MVLEVVLPCCTATRSMRPFPGAGTHKSASALSTRLSIAGEHAREQCDAAHREQSRQQMDREIHAARPRANDADDPRTNDPARNANAADERNGRRRRIARQIARRHGPKDRQRGEDEHGGSGENRQYRGKADISRATSAELLVR